MALRNFYGSLNSNRMVRTSQHTKHGRSHANKILSFIVLFGSTLRSTNVHLYRSTTTKNDNNSDNHNDDDDDKSVAYFFFPRFAAVLYLSYIYYRHFVLTGGGGRGNSSRFECVKSLEKSNAWASKSVNEMNPSMLKTVSYIMVWFV